MIYAVILLLRFIFTFTYYKREKERLEIENDSIREVNTTLNRKMMEMSEKIKANGGKIEENRKEIERIEKMMRVKMKKGE